jgi:hypothetical protein
LALKLSSIGLHAALRAAAALCAGFALAAAHAEIVVPAGGTVNGSGGAVDLACTDLIVGGTFNLGSGSLTNVRDVSILAGGAITATTGSIVLARNWSNQGSFTAGSGTVSIIDIAGCSGPSAISGNTTFNNLTLTSGSGRTVSFAPGSSQTVAGTLVISGTASLPIVLVSGGAQQAAINLAGGGQLISNVAVNNVAATGTPLAPGQTNRNPAGIAVNWFADLFVPTLSGGSLALLSLMILFFALFARGTRTRRSTLG